MLAATTQATALAPTSLSFELPRAATTSAGVYATDGRLLRTLWRGEPLPAGTHRKLWDGRDDHGQPLAPGVYDVRLLHHQLRYVWEGVIGNSSTAQGGSSVHKAYLPPTSIAIEGGVAYYAVGYNERQPGIHGFRLASPQTNLSPLPSTDTFVAYSMIAIDATRLYWANTGGMSRTSFIGAFDLATAHATSFGAGQSVCVNPRPKGNGCYEGHTFSGVIDLHSQEADAPNGLAVQRDGRVLAVAHASQGVIRLFDKTTGQLLHDIALPLARQSLNQIAMTPNGDLWAISGRQVLRFTDLETAPRQVAALQGLVHPLALAAVPGDDDSLWVADGGASQQLKHFDREGRMVATLGQPAGYANDPTVRPDKLCFRARDGREQTALAVAPDHTLWVIDACNNRMLRFRTDAAASGRSDTQIAYLPAFYRSTVDHANPRRVFAGLLELEAELETPWVAGRSWKLVRNWLAGLPSSLLDGNAYNGLFGGFLSVETLANGRTYGVIATHGSQAIVELPPSGPLRVVKWLGMPLPGATAVVMYENGDLGYALTGPNTQQAMRRPLTGFDASGDPVWAGEPVMHASVPTHAGAPYYRGAFSGMPPRFPITGSGKVVFFDQAVVGNEGFHLGAASLGGSTWLWQASPTGALDAKGSFQTKAIDGSLNYGGNAVWAHGRHIVYGYHGEFYKDMQTGQVGQANQFMHFDESGLFLGQFGQASTRPSPPTQPGMSGNAFSPTLVAHGRQLYLYHNDESSHGGVHRWRIDGWDDVRELQGRGALGTTVVLH